MTVGSKKRKDWFIDYISADPDCPLCTNVGIFVDNQEAFYQPLLNTHAEPVGISPIQVSVNDPKHRALSFLHIMYNIYRIPPFHFTDYPSTLQGPPPPPTSLLSSPTEYSLAPTPTHVVAASTSPPLTVSPHISSNIPTGGDAPSNITSVLTTPFAFRPPSGISAYTRALRSQGLEKEFFFVKVLIFFLSRTC
jgi:hypothetical protein